MSKTRTRKARDARRRRPLLSRQTRRKIRGLLFVSPALSFVLLFFVWPLVRTVWMSLHEWTLLGGKKEFVGAQNYREALQDEEWINAIVFTLKYTVFVTPAIFFLGFFLAVMVKDPRPGIRILRTAYFVPVVVGFGASSVLWLSLLDGRVGITNRILEDANLIDEAIIWFRAHSTALTAVVISITWKTVGLTMILLMAGLQAIPRELEEAAVVDGANRVQRFRWVTFPLLRPTFALALILSITGSLLAFDQFRIMTNGGPRNTTITVVYQIFRESFQSFELGYGAALSVLLLLGMAGVTILQLRLLNVENDHDAQG